MGGLPGALGPRQGMKLVGRTGTRAPVQDKDFGGWNASQQSCLFFRFLPFSVSCVLWWVGVSTLFPSGQTHSLVACSDQELLFLMELFFGLVGGPVWLRQPLFVGLPVAMRKEGGGRKSAQLFGTWALNNCTDCCSWPPLGSVPAEPSRLSAPVLQAWL